MEVCVCGATLPQPRTPERAVLALLLLTPGRTVSATAFVDRLWAQESLPANRVDAMQVRVKLRRALTGAGADVVVRDDAGYRVDANPAAIDVARFAAGTRAARAAARERRSDDALARYGEALGLWRGGPLTDFASESWAVVETARLSRLRLEVGADLGPVVGDKPAQEGLAGC